LFKSTWVLKNAVGQRRDKQGKRVKKDEKSNVATGKKDRERNQTRIN
jgi:hypothetical protein